MVYGKTILTIAAIATMFASQANANVVSVVITAVVHRVQNGEYIVIKQKNGNQDQYLYLNGQIVPTRTYDEHGTVIARNTDN